jgi:hypothetical protein
MRAPALYRPFAYDHAKVGRGGHWVTAVARLRPDVSVAAAQRELDARARLDFCRGAQIVPAGLGDAGPLVGAAAVGFEGLGRSVLVTPEATR